MIIILNQIKELRHFNVEIFFDKLFVKTKNMKTDQ